MHNGSIRVLLADDSPVTRLLLEHLLTSEPDIQVVGVVTDGQEALDFLVRGGHRPDVVLMDIHMPRLDGFEATRRIMETRPLPIVICTATSNPREVAVVFRSMEAGAVACVEKPVSPEHPEFDACARNLVQTIRLMSEVKVVRRWPRLQGTASVPVAPASNGSDVDLVGIGASTGGPPVLQTILSGLPKDFPSPILIVQHIARGFVPGLVEWLNQTTGLHVHIAAHSAQAMPGHAYIAPDDFHLGVGPGGRLMLARVDPENGLRPAVSYLFRSLAEVCGSAAIGVILTGMGKDGAAELKHMRDRGAWTIAQDRATSIVHGMPGAAIHLGAAVEVLPADRIATALIAQARSRAHVSGEHEP
jgi:two-component system, chemotaxis family, protein-glutamate methylesterase/glutaminase